MKRSLVPVVVFTMLLSAGLLIPALFNERPASAYEWDKEEDGTFTVCDFVQGQQDVTAMTEHGSFLYVGTLDWDNGGEVWRYDGSTWRRVAAEGFGDPRNDAVTSLAVFGTNLYAGTHNRINGCEIWRFDDTEWTQVASSGLGDGFNYDVSSLAVFDGRLYAGLENNSTGCEVWRTQNGVDWNQVSADGFGDDHNVNSPSMAVYQTRLYVGTHNKRDGCEVWRSSDGTTWNKANTDGFGDTGNESVSSMAVFGGLLYCGTWNGTDGCEMWGYNGTIWNQVNTNGFGTAYNMDASSLAVYNSRLYAGTYQSFGCGVWRYESGTMWTEVNTNGFGDPDNVDATSMIPYGLYLYVGARGWDSGCRVYRTEGIGGPPFTDWAQVNVTGFTGATWYMAEGATEGGFETWILVQNPGMETADVAFDYFTEVGSMGGDDLAAGADSRISVNPSDRAQTFDVSTKVTSDRSVVSERALYFNNRQCATGSIGVTDPAPTWYLAEGATAGGFETWILVLNPGYETAKVAVTYYTDTGVVFGPELYIPPETRLSVNAAADAQTFDVSTKVTSDKPVVAERALYYNNRQCATGSIGVTDPSDTWYLAEGATTGGFETWILVQNPGDETANVTLMYMTKEGEVMGPNLSIDPKSRMSVNVADAVQTFDVSTKVTSDKPVVAERAVYYNNRQCATGSIGVTDPSDTWYLAEGATTGGFETWILVQNPGLETAQVDLTYMTDTGEVAGPSINLGPLARISLNVADTVQTFDVSTKVTSDKPVVAERAVYYNNRQCATGSIGFTAD